jgi:hypothetical protein
MAYQKLLIDNVTCSRRFHITFDDKDAKRAHVELKCPFCDVTIFARDNHQPVKLARQENMVQTAELSDTIVNECAFRDVFSERPVFPAVGNIDRD